MLSRAETRERAFFASRELCVCHSNAVPFSLKPDGGRNIGKRQRSATDLRCSWRTKHGSPVAPTDCVGNAAYGKSGFLYTLQKRRHRVQFTGSACVCGYVRI